jgi:hypothetical protein
MKTDYRTIPGLGSGAGSFRIAMRHRLYQGADHLLLIQSTGFTEDYRRLYYRDIGCVIVRRTQRALWLGILFALLLLLSLFLLVDFWTGGSFPFTNLFFGGLSALFGIILVANLVRGPTCACFLTTEVQTVEVPAPRRMAKVPRLVDFLRAQTASEPSGAAAFTPEA